MRTIGIFMRFSAAALTLALAAAQAQENYSTWTSYRNIVVNTKATGANVGANVVKYPVLVRLDSTAADVFTGAGANGASIRFAKPSGAVRPFQIESWDATAKKASIWVLADTVKANDSTVSLRMYWGKSGAVDSSKGPAVFDSANGFRGVWHLGDSTGAVSTDATIFGTNAAWVNAPVLADGLIGKAVNLNQPTSGLSSTTAKYLRANYNLTNNNFKTNSTDGLTLSAWVNRTSQASDNEQGILGRYNWNAAGRQALIGTNNNNLFRLFRSTNGGNASGAEVNFGKTAVVDGQWFYVAATVKNGSQILYVNGTQDSAQATATIGSLDSIWATTSALCFGRMACDGGTVAQAFRGILDEPRFTAASRSADWVKLDYETQKPASAVVRLGTTQSTTPTAPSALAYPDTLKAGIGVAVNIVPTYVGFVDSFTVAPALPDSLKLNKVTGTITGTGRTPSALTAYVITATNGVGSAKDTIRISVTAVAPSNLVYPQQSASYIAGAIAASNVPTVSGVVDSFTVSPALPAGLTLNKANGVISGKPTAVTAAANYTVTAVNSAGNAKDTVNITVTAATADGAYTGWSNHKFLTINTRTAGALQSIRKFPLLVRLDSTNFSTGFSQTAFGGSDLRFTKTGDAVRLPHQIESWDAVAKRGAVWVLVDSVRGDNVTNIRMHWGKAGVADSSNGAAVFETSNGFGAVWHMNEPSGNILDATANGVVGTNTGTTATTGMIGAGRNFAGTNAGNNVTTGVQTIAVGDPAELDLGTGRVTLEAWVRWVNLRPTTGTVYWRNIIMRQSGSDELHLRIDGNTPYNYRMGAYIGSTDYGPLSEQTAAAYGDSAKWVHLVGVYDSVNATSNAYKLYRNGVLVGTGTEGDPIVGGRGSWYIGQWSGTTNRRFWSGDMDEIRISKTHRSASWVKLSYETQKAAPLGISFADTATGPLALGHFARTGAAGSLSARASGAGVLFRVQAGTAASFRLSVLDLRGREVWTQAFSGSGDQTVAWDGRSTAGSRTSSGIYTVRAVLLDARGKVSGRFEKSLPLVR